MFLFVDLLSTLVHFLLVYKCLSYRICVLAVWKIIDKRIWQRKCI